MFGLGFISLIDKPTRVCKNSVTIIDNIRNKCLFSNTLKKGTVKSDISDQLLIIFTIHTGKNQSK